MSHHQNAWKNRNIMTLTEPLKCGKVQIFGNDSDKILFMAKLRYDLELNSDHHSGKPVSELDVLSHWKLQIW
jgi:hypothetical protein